MPDNTDSAPRDEHWVRGIRYPDGNRVYKIRKKTFILHTYQKNWVRYPFQNHLLVIFLEQFRT